MQATNDAHGHGDDLSLGDLVLKVLRFYADFGGLLIPVALLVALLAGAMAALNPVYSASALLETSQMPLDQWRRLQPMLSDRTLVAASLAEAGLPPAQESRMLRAFQQPAYWTARVKHRPTVGRDDVREQINIDPKKVGVLGLEVALKARDDAHAQQQLDLIAQHIRQVMLWGDLSEYLDRTRQSVLERRLQLQIDQIKHQFSIEQNLRQVDDMQKLLQQYPELRRSEVNTVVSVGDGGGKYLSPLAQIVALQSTIAETRTAQRQLERELAQYDWLQRFVDLAGERALTLHSGSALADWLEQQQRTLFPADTDMDAVQRQVGREIQIQLAQMRYKAEQLRFRAQPALSVAPVASRRPWLVAGAAFAGSLLALSVALACYVAVRRMGAAGTGWSPQRDPLFAWMPERLRRWLWRTEMDTSQKDCA